MKYWIGVVTKDHVQRGISLGIAQIGHGKATDLRRMQAGDYLVHYSPKATIGTKTVLQAFTALSRISDSEIYQADEGNFNPWRRRVEYLSSVDAPIRPMLANLSFTKGKTNWGYAFRYGFLEMTESDFYTIAQEMQAEL